MGDPSIWGGKYAVHDEIASGGMATVYVAERLEPSPDIPRIVALKKLAPQHAKQPEFIAMFLDEAHLAARIRHANVVTTYEVLRSEGQLAIIMDLVVGESLMQLLRADERDQRRAPPAIAERILVDVLRGLHAAHESTDGLGKSLALVHRDVSPHNVLVGEDGVARVIDFGIAKAAGRLQTTDLGILKGKFAYMPPEQIRGAELTRAGDIYSAGVVLWEALVGRRLFRPAGDEKELTDRGEGKVRIVPPSGVVSEIPRVLDDIVLRALEFDPERRFATAKEMSDALERRGSPASAEVVADWVRARAGERIRALRSKRDAIGSRARKHRPMELAPEPDALPEIELQAPPPVANPMRPVTSRRPVPAPRARSSFAGGAALLVLALVLAGSALFVLTTLRARVVRAAAARGIALTLDRAELSSAGLVLRGVRASPSGCDTLVFSAASAAVDFDGLDVGTVHLPSYELVVRRGGSAAACLRKWFSAPRAAVHVDARGGHLVWQAPFSRTVGIEALDVAIDMGSDGVRADTASLLIGMPRGHVGPWRAHADVSRSETRLRVGLDASSSDGPPSIVLVDREGSGAQLAVNIPRDSIVKLGVPDDLVGLTDDLSLEASVEARMPPLGAAIEADATVSLFGVHLGGSSSAKADVLVQGSVNGPLSSPLPIQLGVIAVGSAKSPLTGTLTFFDDGVRVALDRPASMRGMSPLVLDTRDWTGGAKAASFGATP